MGEQGSVPEKEGRAMHLKHFPYGKNLQCLFKKGIEKESRVNTGGARQERLSEKKPRLGGMRGGLI